MYKKPRAILNLLFTFALGVPHKQEETHNLPVVFSNPHQARPGVKSGCGELVPNPSLQEGVKIFYLAACAATRLIHYTPPPFDDAIVPEDFNCCQAFAENS